MRESPWVLEQTWSRTGFVIFPPHTSRSFRTFEEVLGYTPADALIAATRTNAEIIDMEDKLGTLQEGRLADIIVVDGRPDEDLEDLAKIQMVIR